MKGGVIQGTVAEVLTILIKANMAQNFMTPERRPSSDCSGPYAEAGAKANGVKPPENR